MRKEVRKHYCQMSQREKKFVEARLNQRRAMVDTSNITIQHHAKERMNSRKRFDVNIDMIVESIKDSDFHEYKIIRVGDEIVDERVLIRSRKDYRGNNIILVYSILQNKVITFWSNYKTDRHISLDLSLYDKEMKIVGIVK